MEGCARARLLRGREKKTRSRVRVLNDAEVAEEVLGDDARARVEREPHRGNLLVDVLHKENDKVHEFRLPHLVQVRAGDEEAACRERDPLVFSKLSSKRARRRVVGLCDV